VSIIIPVYNAQAFLKKTIVSILNQSYQNIELILIDDGSTDESGIICDEFLKKDARITVIHQKNAGVSASRNAGIIAAKGEFIQFVDADDYIEETMTQILVDGMNEDVDLVICSYKTEYLKNDLLFHQDHICPYEGVYDKKELLLSFGELFNKRFINPIWNKLYRTDLLKKNQIFFDKNFSMGEDLLFNLRYLEMSELFFLSKALLYNYINSNAGSLTASVHKDLFINQQLLFAQVRNFLIKYDAYNEINEKFVENSFTDSVIRSFENLFHSKTELSKKAKKTEIEMIISDATVRNSMPYFSQADAQKFLLAKMIGSRNSRGIYCFFKVKTFFRKHLKPVFRLLKKVLEKGVSNKD
jgi:glycosyltransferase involved in cell wall biosynthesis